MSHSGRFPADDLLAARLAAGETVTAAAGVSAKTAHRRLANPHFRSQVQALRDQMVSAAAAGTLAASLGRATATLTALLDAPAPAVRLRAAVQVIELGLKARELVDLQAQVAELRDAADARQDSQIRDGGSRYDHPE